MRKQIITPDTTATRPPPSTIYDVASLAQAAISSEDEAHPLENAFDGKGGPGGTFWRAREDGEQTLILAFDAPLAIRRVRLEIEETELNRTQELQLAVSTDGGTTYRELVRQEFNFSPPNTRFEREDWAVEASGSTHLRLKIKPDKGGRIGRASLTTLALSGS